MEVLNFIVVEDSKSMLDHINDEIKKISKKFKINYNIYSFRYYSSEYKTISISNIQNKVFIFDIDINLKTKQEKLIRQFGLDEARILREKDLQSNIIFLSAYDYKKEAISTVFECTKYIKKSEDIHVELEKTIKYIIKKIGKLKIVKFKDKDVYYSFMLDDINFFEKEKSQNFCLLHTKYGHFKLSKTLKAINEITNNEFELLNRCYLINSENIVVRDKNHIIFKDGEILKL